MSAEDPKAPEEKQYRNVRSFDAVDCANLPLFRTALNQLAAEPDVDVSTFAFISPYQGAVRIVFQRVRKERVK